MIEEPDNYVLWKHSRCASHRLNLIATSDLKKAINTNVVLRNRHTQLTNKCIQLEKAWRQKSFKILNAVLGHTFSAPGVTRWNSYNDSLKQIVQGKEN